MYRGNKKSPYWDQQENNRVKARAHYEFCKQFPTIYSPSYLYETTYLYDPVKVWSPYKESQTVLSRNGIILLVFATVV